MPFYTIFEDYKPKLGKNSVYMAQNSQGKVPKTICRGAHEVQESYMPLDAEPELFLCEIAAILLP
jgi:hypothetical protein